MSEKLRELLADVELICADVVAGSATRLKSWGTVSAMSLSWMRRLPLCSGDYGA
jgi:hypothetical protein